MFDIFLFKKNDKYNIYEKSEANIRNELTKPLFIQKFSWYLLLGIYILYIYFNNNNVNIINIGLVVIEIILISEVFVISKRSMYVYKLKIELESDSKKLLYSKYVFKKWVALINNAIFANCIIFYNFGFKFCLDILIILLAINIIRLLSKLGINKFRLFMIKESLNSIIEESEEKGFDSFDLSEHIDDAEELEVLFGSRYYSITKEVKIILSKIEEVTSKEKNSIYSKSQLVTNLSHDLKTPLTSIINSIYILKNESLDNKEREDQINILRDKSIRLKTLIDNLNEVINSEEDEIILNKEYLNIHDLLKGCIDDNIERLSNLGLDIKLNTSNTNLTVYMDKDKTTRVFENLLDNIAKYSLEDTRVYVDLKEDDNLIKISFKNICKYELEVSNKTLGSRFVKGDKSRNGEGYGLGLSIVKNLIRVQGGKLEIISEGDLFKTGIMLKKYEIS